MEGMDSLRGHLLVAGPSLWDPTFRRTIVLVAHHDEEGAVGVVLNRVAPVTVAEAVPVLAELVPAGERLLLGGPVQPSAAVVIDDLEDPSRADLVAFDSVGVLPPNGDRSELAGIRRARVFAGFAGWSPGQLDAELRDDAWAVERANADDVFAPDPDRLWDLVQRRRGPEGALLRHMPMDPSTN
jgi:putative transcriptional regulator